MPLKVLVLLLAVLPAFSCRATVEGEGRVRLEHISALVERCSHLAGRRVEFKGRFAGWRCGSKCLHPGVTRSDVCVEDETACIYLSGTGRLDPLKDRGKTFLFQGFLRKSPKGVCYVEVEKVVDAR
jgi:hypothetical protein